MNDFVSKQVTKIVKQRLGDEFTELLQNNKHYKRIISDRASLCQKLVQGELAIIDQYIELDEEIMEIETYHAYLLGVSEAKIFQDLQNTMNPDEWNELVATCTSQFASKLDLDKDIFISSNRFSRLPETKRIPILIAALGMVICLLTGAVHAGICWGKR